MTDLAWMKTYIGDEAALTGHLTAEEFGAYERLRRHYWQHGRLPDDDSRRMRVTGVDPDRWDGVRSAICELFDEGWRLPRLDLERDVAEVKRERKVAAGRKGAAQRWRPGSRTNADAIPANDGKPIADANSKRMAEPMAKAMDSQWPPAPDEVRYDERYALTRTHARDDDEELPLDPPEDEGEGRDWLIRQGVWPKHVPDLLPDLMAGALRRSRIDETLKLKRKEWS